MPFVQDPQGQYHADGAISADDILTEAAAIITRRHVGKSLAEVIADPTRSSALFKARLAHLEHEEFHVAFLDSRHRLIAVEVLSRGTIDGAEVHPREIAKRALALNAAACLAAHNHPSGSAEPSAADRAVTSRLKQTLALIDVRFLDHLVVAGDNVVSLAARGWV